MLRRVALVRTDVSEELSASIIRVTRIGELGTTLAVTLYGTQQYISAVGNQITILGCLASSLVTTLSYPGSTITRGSIHGQTRVDVKLSVKLHAASSGPTVSLPRFINLHGDSATLLRSARGTPRPVS
jgi:hypothetical protein